MVGVADRTMSHPAKWELKQQASGYRSQATGLGKAAGISTQPQGQALGTPSPSLRSFGASAFAEAPADKTARQAGSR